MSSFEAPQSVKPSKRECIFTFLTQPHSSLRAKNYSWYLDAIVGLSILKFCFESVPDWSRTTLQRSLFFALESVVAAHLAVDFALKLSTQPTWRDYIGTWDALIDLLSLVPWAVDLYRLKALFGSERGAAVKHYNALRLLRLLRYIRFLRITVGNFPRMGLFVHAVRRSGLAILFLAVYVFGAGLFFSGCLYYAETSICTLDPKTGIWMLAANPQTPCAVQNMFQAIWLCMVTMASVGYGDIVPFTALGRVILVVLMITSMIFLPLPASIFGANLTELYLEDRLVKRRNRGHHDRDDSRNVSAENTNWSAMSRSGSPGPSFSSRNVHGNVNMPDSWKAEGKHISVALAQANRLLLDAASRQRRLERVLVRYRPSG